MKLNSRKTENLIKTVVALENVAMAKQFLRDLLTEKELEEISNRWEAAQLLDRKVSYSVIQKQTNLSSTTISRISKWLNNGKGGYKLMINKTNHHHSSTPVRKGLR